jgi:murein L,D-transpeptidase YcbB/YkuD
VAAPGQCGCFTYQDSSPQSDGTSKTYAVCFRTWVNDEEGVEALVRTVYSQRREIVLEAAKANNIWAFSAAMYDTAYYQGFGATRDIRISHHADSMRRIVATIENALKNSVIPTVESGSRNLQRGMDGDDVKQWQTRLNADGAHLNADGSFGLLTETATRGWQQHHGLAADGVVGPKTRSLANL